MSERVFNFSAGPSVLPKPVLEKAQRDLLNYNASGMSVMEMSHRSPVFQEIFDSAKSGLKEALSVPDTHEILFLQGGATLQFASVPMNLMKSGCADYAVTGNFSDKAAKEAEKYGTVHIAASTGPEFRAIPAQKDLSLSPDAEYLYYCANNTVFGTEWQYVPETSSPLVCDMSSNILSKPVDVSRYGLIFAGAQKNMAPAGLTVVIIDKALAGRELAITPKIMSYKVNIDNDSMLNTPPCWCIYMLSLTLEWLKSIGGVKAMQEIKHERAAKVYDFLDNSSMFTPHADKTSRSEMNITFRTGSSELDAQFVKEAAARGLINLKGHKVAGGMRASLYNAMPMEGVDALISFMKEFELSHV
ncbi:MAG: 3-phosphoserine/phosphohydroxythreonine transaminase [Eubacteriales bacterium]|nr:3-phosphoserine/phosphohydroxythreonine transaminase [Eubacteriales bacterium]